MANVILRKCEEYDLEALRAIVRDGLAQLSIPALKPGAKVLVKPNLLMKRDPERHTTTHPAVVEAVVSARTVFLFSSRYSIASFFVANPPLVLRFWRRLPSSST